ncbi:MAG: ATP-grasp domain-containing protein, partial [Spirochaetales bacterium]|nr:ATP-grasp domain-containing protein [Spirochaetales bacterium]
KATKGGYDGKGNSLIKSKDMINKSFTDLGFGKIPLIAEKFCPFIKEISVLSCRDLYGNITVYPVAENIHIDSILDETLVPAEISEHSRVLAMEMAHSVMEVFSDVGMFCTEMFVTEDGSVLLNEVAPRPHNSGHYTIEGCFVSQYEAHIKAITGLTVGDVSLRTPVVMKNILGSGKEGKTIVYGADELHQIPNVKLHLYGKETSREKRKMAHITAIGKTVHEAQKSVQEAYNAIKIEGF